MAYHKSSEKRIRQTAVKNERNKYYAKTMRNALKDIRSTTDKKEATKMLPKMNEMLDKLEFITRFNVNVRYPDYQQEFYKICTKEFSLDALKTINEVRLWLQNLIRIY